jgi:hypothetical protein
MHYKKLETFRQRAEMKTFVSAMNTGEKSSTTKRYSVTATTLRYILTLSHDALCCGRMFLSLKVIILGMKEPLSLLIVIALVTS